MAVQGLLGKYPHDECCDDDPAGDHGEDDQPSTTASQPEHRQGDHDRADDHDDGIDLKPARDLFADRPAH